MTGSAILRCLREEGFGHIVTRTHQELDLTDSQAVRGFIRSEPIACIILAAARVGGIHANNTYPAEFIQQNLLIQANVIHEAQQAGVNRLVFLGSSCIYPRQAPQPMREEYLLTGPLEPTNEPYAVAKIAGIKMCESYNRQYGTHYRSVMPTNLYGPHDNFHPSNSHVLPSLLRKFHLAKQTGAPEVEVWGSGRSRREFLHVADMAAATVFVMGLGDDLYARHTQPMVSHLNVGSGTDVTIAEAAETVQRVVGYGGRIRFNPEQPDGAPRKLLDVSKLTTMGWRAQISLEEGLGQTYQWFLANQEQLRE